MASFKILSTCALVEHLHNVHKALISRLECLPYSTAGLNINRSLLKLLTSNLFL